jgi:hypothetical protein
MTRRYDDPVQVREVAGEPELFLWHGRLYQVRSVLARWCEARPWWREVGKRSAGAAAGPDTESDAAHRSTPLAVLAADRMVWRVEASSGQARRSGVFDLVSEAQGWTLVQVSD